MPKQTPLSPLASQLVLRSGTQQLVVGTDLPIERVAGIIERAFTRHGPYPSAGRIWGFISVELVRHSGNVGVLTLAIPTLPDVPSVWVSELDGGRWSVNTIINGETQWSIVDTGLVSVAA